MRELGRWVLVVSALAGAALIGCESAPVGPENDAGLDGGTNMTTPDSGPMVEVCDRDSVCRDELFCNGEERCLPGERGADERGCVAGMPPCAETERCIEAEDRCELDDCADGGDADNDGDRRPGCGGMDCNDEDGRVSSMAQEVCDAAGLDEDCNPETIHNTRTNDGDMDADGFIDVRCFNRRRDGTENGGTDCADMRPTVNPSGVESCNLIDDDCNGMVDEGVEITFYRDTDGDNYGVSSTTMLGCTRPEGGWAFVDGDCNDMSSAVHPAVAEICDGVDNDCDDVIDPPTLCACTTGVSEGCGPDTDVGRCAFGTRVCVAGRWSDCAGAVLPRAEVCNGEDDDCDGPIDEGVLNTYYRDGDGDNYGVAALTMAACTQPADGWVPVAGDCADSDPSRHPAAPEQCDGIDTNCDERNDPVTCECINGVNETCGPATDVGRCAFGGRVCIDGRWSACTGAILPRAEVCNGEDDDCDGAVDEGVALVCYRNRWPEQWGASSAAGSRWARWQTSRSGRRGWRRGVEAG